MPAALLVQILCALIGQMPAIIALIDKLKAEGRDQLTDDEVAHLQAVAPVAHKLLLVAAGRPSCQTCAQVAGVKP